MRIHFKREKSPILKLQHAFRLLAVLTALAVGFAAQAQTRVTLTTSSASPWTVPAGVTSVKVEMWGGGGGGGGSSSNKHSGGGGGGAYTVTTLTVTPLSQIAFVVGAGGAAGTATVTSGGSGGNTTFSGATTANGGGGGIMATSNYNPGTGGAGGGGGTFNGGNGSGGGPGRMGPSGGGGASGCAEGAGGSGSLTTTAGGLPAGPDGGAGGIAGTADGVVTAGSGGMPGGGGGGGNGSAPNGGAGAAGQIIITYTALTAVTITSGLTVNSKTYDGTTTATITSNNVVLSGVQAGDVGNVALSTNGYTATFANAAVANGVAVTVSGLTLTGSAAGKYALTQPTGLTANITPATVAITSGLTANNKIYNGSTTATITSNNVVLGGVVAGDAAKVALSTNGYTATFASAAVANGVAVTVSGLTLTGSAAGDYTLTQPTGLSANITPGPVTAAQSTVSAAPASVVANGSATSTITVTLKDASSNPVSGKTVTLAKTSGTGSPVISAASGPSSASGVVTFTVSSSTPATAGDVFTATDTTDNVTVTQTATIIFTALPPVATPMTVVVPTGLKAQISLSDLATNWSDFYGYPVSLTAINFTSANGLTVYPLNLTTNAGAYLISSSAFLGYINPAASVSDSITYTLSDGQGNTTNGVINIVGSASPLFGQTTGLISPGGNAVTVNFGGQPGYTYSVQRSLDLSTSKTIWTTNAPPGGPFSYTDTFGDLGGVAPSSAYYRLAWVP